MPKVKDIVGEKYGRLTVVKFYGIKNHKAMFECICECGNTTIAQGQLLRRGTTKSCGCLLRETREKCRKTHGMTDTHLYGVWCTMKSRCHNPKSQRYELYGGRGIEVCEEWRNSFETFYEWAIANGYKDGLTIDRIDVDKDYRPDNCRWATVKQQQNNRRNNRLIEYNGETRTLHEWSDKLNIKYGTLHYRLKAGWSIEKAFSTP